MCTSVNFQALDYIVSPLWVPFIRVHVQRENAISLASANCDSSEGELVLICRYFYESSLNDVIRLCFQLISRHFWWLNYLSYRNNFNLHYAQNIKLLTAHQSPISQSVHFLNKFRSYFTKYLHLLARNTDITCAKKLSALKLPRGHRGRALGCKLLRILVIYYTALSPAFFTVVISTPHQLLARAHFFHQLSNSMIIY